MARYQPLPISLSVMYVLRYMIRWLYSARETTILAINMGPQFGQLFRLLQYCPRRSRDLMALLQEDRDRVAHDEAVALTKLLIQSRFRVDIR